MYEVRSLGRLRCAITCEMQNNIFSPLILVLQNFYTTMMGRNNVSIFENPVQDQGHMFAAATSEMAALTWTWKETIYIIPALS